eukprot:GFYU01004946.1.p1 GENE.GFYU01004946.1~~GFYU01004946.1.p1  ORF type:complete len:324 (+),score=68.39 GFYU01004946.1:74-1045(+)
MIRVLFAFTLCVTLVASQGICPRTGALPKAEALQRCTKYKDSACCTPEMEAVVLAGLTAAASSVGGSCCLPNLEDVICALACHPDAGRFAQVRTAAEINAEWNITTANDTTEEHVEFRVHPDLIRAAMDTCKHVCVFGSLDFGSIMGVGGWSETQGFLAQTSNPHELITYPYARPTHPRVCFREEWNTTIALTTADVTLRPRCCESTCDKSTCKVATEIAPAEKITNHLVCDPTPEFPQFCTYGYFKWDSKWNKNAPTKEQCPGLNLLPNTAPAPASSPSSSTPSGSSGPTTSLNTNNLSGASEVAPIVSMLLVLTLFASVFA